MLLSAGATPAADQPRLPYYSVQLGTAPNRDEALQRLQPFKDLPHARAERRRAWQVRAGAWPSRAEAEAALGALGPRAPGARVLQMETAVPWLLPDGTTVALGTRSPAEGAAAEAKRDEPPPTATPAPAPGEPIFFPTPEVPPARPVAIDFDLAPDFREDARKLDEEVRRWLRVSGVAHRDGYTYSADIGALMLYAALRGDAGLYEQLLPYTRDLIMERPGDTYTRGFVVWRRKPGEAPEVTGAAEALWLARALWQGAAAFGRAQDRAQALRILEGYARHAYELEGVWVVRKYFAFGGGGFSGLSTLAGYHPDFMSDLGPDWREFAERSQAMLERTRLPSGLLAPLIQPEVGATYPQLNVVAHAPNGVAALLDSCMAAETALRRNPALARGLLAFARDGDHRGLSYKMPVGRLYAYFRGDTGEPVTKWELSGSDYACLARLAAGLGDERSFEHLLPWLRFSMREFTSVPSAQQAPLYDGAQLLLAAYAAGAFNASR